LTIIANTHNYYDEACYWRIRAKNTLLRGLKANAVQSSTTKRAIVEFRKAERFFLKANRVDGAEVVRREISRLRAEESRAGRLVGPHD
jgi:hypothetical protein